MFCIRVRRTLSSHNASPPSSENWYWLSVREKNFWEGGWEGERVICDKAIIQWSESGLMSYKSEEADLDLTFMVHFLSMQVLIRTGIQRTTTSSPKVNYCFIALCFSWIFPASFKKNSVLVKLLVFVLDAQPDQLISLHGQVTTLKLENEMLKEQLQVSSAKTKCPLNCTVSNWCKYLCFPLVIIAGMLITLILW